MERSRRERDSDRQPNSNTGSFWIGSALGAVAATGIAAAAYYFTSSRSSSAQIQEPNRPSPSSIARQQPSTASTTTSVAPLSIRERISSIMTSNGNTNIGIPKSSVVNQPRISNTDELLKDIYVRFVALKNEDCNHYYKVFCGVFNKMQVAMKEVDPYYNRYSSKKQFAGSHFDHLRIKKPSEYDMDIAIKLPLNFDFDPIHPEQSDLIIEPKGAGFVQLKTGAQFKNIYKRDGIDVAINKTAIQWADETGYLLGSKFISWFKSVVDKALNTFPLSCTGKRVVYVDGTAYDVGLSSSGPAITICIKGPRTFSLDVDFVPALRFPESRWPSLKQYRPILESYSTGEFMVVPKKNPAGKSELDKERSWRLAMQDQEKKLMHDKKHMKQVIRLMKKFRDSNKMNSISSYYIKTLFFWEIEKQLNSFWSENNIEYLFRFMMGRLKEAVINGNIPYFWNKKNNLIQCKAETLGLYARAIDKVLPVLDNRLCFKDTAKYLLDVDEYEAYQRILFG